MLLTTHFFYLLKHMNLFILKLLALAFLNVTVATHYVHGSDTAEYRLQWKPHSTFPVNEYEYIDVLYFENAHYSDTLPQLPIFSVQLPLDIPHFSYQFAIHDKEFIAVSSKEEAVLRDIGFVQGEISLNKALQSSRKQRFMVLNLYPFVYDTEKDEYKKLHAFSLSKDLVYDPGVTYIQPRQYPEQSVLASGSWYKLCVEETGIYRLNYDDLDALGIDMPALQKQNIRFFGNGGGMLPEANNASIHDDLVENAIYVSGSPNGSFGQSDYILFYGQSPDTWRFDETYSLFRYERHLYSNNNCYYITTDQGQGKRIQPQPGLSEDFTHQVTDFTDMGVHQRDMVSLINSGRVWFGEVFDATVSRQFSFNFPNINTNRNATVEAFLAARASVLSTFTLNAGNRQKNLPIAPINPTDYNGNYVQIVTDTLHFTPSGTNVLNINLTYNRPGSGTRGWLNYLVVNVSRQLRFTGQQMAFRNTEYIGNGNVLEYRLADAGSQVRIWDVSDIFNIREQETSPDGNQQRFRLPGDNLREFIAFDGTHYLAPELRGRISNQNLHAMQAKDLIIVSPPEFVEEAGRLAAYRSEYNGLTAAVVSTQEVYNEFSSGKADASAIRNFMKMFYDRAQTPDDVPRYLLLFGNGTVDNRGVLDLGGNLIPTFQSLDSYSPRFSYMTDDYFGLLDDHEGSDAHGIPDIGIGRVPARNVEEAALMVDKIIRYDKRIPGMAPGEENLEYTAVVSNFADWRNKVVFIADDGDGNLHLNHAEILAGILKEHHPQYNIQKIYLDAYQQITMAGGARYPEVNRALNERVNQGALMINYIGHGGTRGLAHQRILTNDDVAQWNNVYNMPVFMTATCEFSSFDQPDPDNLSTGVRIVLKPKGGTVGLFTTTRIAWSSHNLVLNRNFMDATFSRDSQGRHYHMGDLIRIAKKNSSSSGTTPRQLRNFVLLGDPSMQMAYPEHRVVTQSMPDTLRAFQEVEVTGYVTCQHGNIMDNYNGVLFPTIYDKKNTFQTLGNNSDSNPAEFSMRNSILYKGKASVENGSFSFRFIVPKDIAYNYGGGKISYYLDDGIADGHGYYSDFIIGGTADTFDPDYTGPDIDLFMNDTNFVSGDYTHENPILLAYLFDESGINITGSVGHDIVAYLNNDVSNPLRLNHFFEADLDTYQSGRVVYPFYRLEDGHHTLSLRAWDIHNNPSTASIDFVVSSKGQLVLEHLMNYPNPFSHETWFAFKHNQAFSELDVRIDIYDLQGRLVNTINERVFPVGFQSTPIHWDGLSNDGRPLGNGLYLYRLTMTTPEGKRARQTEKLMIFR